MRKDVVKRTSRYYNIFEWQQCVIVLFNIQTGIFTFTKQYMNNKKYTLINSDR